MSGWKTGSSDERCNKWQWAKVAWADCLHFLCLVLGHLFILSKSALYGSPCFFLRMSYQQVLPRSGQTFDFSPNRRQESSMTSFFDDQTKKYPKSTHSVVSCFDDTRTWAINMRKLCSDVTPIQHPHVTGKDLIQCCAPIRNTTWHISHSNLLIA